MFPEIGFSFNWPGKGLDDEDDDEDEDGSEIE